MLQTVIRPSIDMSRKVLPAYSKTWPVPPAVPILAMIARITSFGLTPAPSLPLTEISMFLAGAWIRVWVASTCSTSEVPMPKASAPIAPCVAVWLSPQTIVMPGWLRPCSGPMMWTMPWSMLSIGKYGTPNSLTLRSSTSTCSFDSGSSMPATPALRLVVGMLWSATAIVASGRRTLRPASFNPSKACGVVTSWIR